MPREDPERGREPVEADESGRTEADESDTRPQPELRWVQLQDPKGAAELGRNGRVVERVFHERYDAWELLLVTYEGELTESRRQNG